VGPVRANRRRLALAAVVASAASFLPNSATSATLATPSCPPIANKPDQVPHIHYAGVKHLTYCYGPISIQPGQNYIRLNATNLFPKVPGYITRFDPEFVYPSGRVPRVDILHLHHAVWIVNGNPQFAVGEEKTITQLPRHFGWPTRPTDSWLINDMLHDLTPEPATVYVVWRIDFVPATARSAASIHPVRTQWMSVAGPDQPVGISSRIYPVFDALRGTGRDGRYTFPDQATGAETALIASNQSWTPDRPVTLIGTAGHLHPGGLYTDLRVTRRDRTRRIFRSRAHYYEPAGEVSWDVAMTATPRDWRVQLRPGDRLSVHATYDTKRASWYEVMGIMPVAVYDGSGVGGVDAFSSDIPKRGVLTHGHLTENNHHGGKPSGLPNPLDLPDGPTPDGPIEIRDYQYSRGDLYASGKARRPPTIHAGQSLTFDNRDAAPATNTFHTITSCRAPCNRSTGIAYPIANAPVRFDSAQLGVNYKGFGAPASGRLTWQTSARLRPGTYTFFCRIHPFMRGSFRVVK
jgi:plastocyanin